MGLRYSVDFQPLTSSLLSFEDAAETSAGSGSPSVHCSSESKKGVLHHSSFRFLNILFNACVHVYVNICKRDLVSVCVYVHACEHMCLGMCV